MITNRFLLSQLLFLAGGVFLVALGMGSFILAQVRGINHEAMALKVSGSFEMVIGCLTFFEGFYGCCSMFFKKFSLLNNLRDIFMVIAVSAFLTGCYNTIVFQIITNQEQSQWTLTYEMAESSGWKLIQTVLHCCGLNNYTDWLGVDKFRKQGRLPSECCNFKAKEMNHTSICEVGFFKIKTFKAVTFIDGCKIYVKNMLSYFGAIAIILPFLLMANQLLVINWTRLRYEHYEED